MRFFNKGDQRYNYILINNILSFKKMILFNSIIITCSLVFLFTLSAMGQSYKGQTRERDLPVIQNFREGKKMVLLR